MEKYLPVVAIGLLCLTVITITLTMIIEIWMGKASDKNEYRFEIRQEMYDDLRKHIIKFIMYHKKYYINDDGIDVGTGYHKGCKNALEGVLNYIDKIQGEEVHRHVRKK